MPNAKWRIDMLGRMEYQTAKSCAKSAAALSASNSAARAREAFVKPLSKILSQPEAVRRAWPLLSRPAQKLLGTLPLMRSNNLVFLQQAKQAFQMIDGKAAANFTPLLRELNNAGLVSIFSNNSSVCRRSWACICRPMPIMARNRMMSPA